MRHRSLLASTTLLLFGCAEQPLPTDASLPHSGAPAFEIVDGAHLNGNRHFFFLPPLVPNPTVNGTPDRTLAPVVRICEWNGECSAVVAEFTVTTGTASQVVSYDAGQQRYHVNWRTDQCSWGPCTLDPARTYRLNVTVGAQELGHADLQVFANASQAKNLVTNEYIPLVDGRTLPVSFRIETGIVGAVTVTPNPVTIGVAATTALTATVVDLHGNALIGPVVTWSTGASTVASVSASGILTGVSSGCTTIAATSQGVSGTANAAVTPLDRDLVFIKRVDNDPFLYAARVDGCVSPVRISSTRVNDQWGFDVSPDGRRVTFVGFRENDLHVAAVDGSSDNVLSTSGIVPTDPSWSFDGSQLAFLGFSGFSALFVMSADGSGLHRVTQPFLLQGGFNHIAHPRWSPTGSRIAFTRWEMQTGGLYALDLYAVDADGSNVLNLTAGSGRNASEAEWSPDGTRLAYVNGYFSGNGFFVDASQNGIWVIGADGSGSTQVGVARLSAGPLAWSRDGAEIAFVGIDALCPYAGIGVVPSAGGSARALWCTGLYDTPLGYRIAWSRDGREVLFGEYGFTLWAVGRDGASSPRFIGSGYQPVVRP